MRKLIGALLTLTALSPMAATAQEVRADMGVRGDEDGRFERRTRVEPGVQLRADVRRDDGPGFDRGDRPDQASRGVGAGFGRGDRPDRDPRGGGGDGFQPRAPLERDAARFDDRAGRTDRDRLAGRSGDGAPRPDPRGRREDRRGSDWTRSRLDRRDDRWTQSRFQERAAWNRGWRNDRRYDWNDYRADNRSAYRLPRYYAPYGQSGGYRRFGIGVSLQSQLWGRNYWIADPYSYRLPEAYGPYRWVRYYDDALLVDLRTGLVADAVYGIFW